MIFCIKIHFYGGVSQRTLAVEGVRYDILFVGAYSRESVGSNDPDQRIFTTPIAKKHLAKYPGKIFSTNGIGHTTLGKALQWCFDFAGIAKR